MSKQQVSRRAFLRLMAGTAGALVFSSCRATSPESGATPEPTKPAPTDTPEPEQPTATPKPTNTPKPGEPTATPTPPYNEPPMLQSMVDSGELPPVWDRIPKNPFVSEAIDGIGNYGGTLHRTYDGWGDKWGLNSVLKECCTQLVLNADGEYELLPNYISEWSQNEDATEFTWVLREGLKWSDGVPFTTEDIQFYFDNIFVPNIITGHGDIARPGSVPLELEVIDELTYKFKFAVPFATYPVLLASTKELNPMGGPTMALPKHYLEQFIPGIGDQDFIDAKMEEYDVSTIEELLDMQGFVTNIFFNAELPHILPWLTTSPVPGDPFELTRNPYYYKVDAEGNQLPYADKLNFRLVADQNMLDINIAAGNVDWQSRDVRIGNLPFYVANQVDGNYQVLLWEGTRKASFGFNESYEDDAVRELVTNRTFIQALSHAIDRNELNMLVGDGLNTPMQRCPASGTPYWDQEWADRWTEYDVDKANELLDSMGMEVGGDGFRTRPDGQPFTLNLEAEPNSRADLWEPVSVYLQAVGINCTSEIKDKTLYRAQRANNELLVYDLGMQTGAGPMSRADIARGYQFAPAYYAWYVVNELGGDSGNAQIKPPDGHYIWELWDAVNEILEAPNLEAEAEGWNHYFALCKQNRAIIGIWGKQPAIYIAHNSVGNILQRASSQGYAIPEKAMAMYRMYKKDAV